MNKDKITSEENVGQNWDYVSAKMNLLFQLYVE